MAATQRLLQAAEKCLNTPVASKTGLFRIPTSPHQLKEFQTSSQLYNIPWSKSLGQEALFIPDALTVNCPLYLEGLWASCLEQGSSLQIDLISSPSQLSNLFDIIIIAAGADSTTLHPDLPLKPLKGQIITVYNSFNISTPTTTDCYIIPQNNLLTIGATFERNFSSPLPDPALASQSLLPTLDPFLPNISSSTILSCKAGIRATTPNRLPLLKKLSHNTWIASGLGSKGLLYHSLLGQNTTKTILS
jgi:glycine/D-amino acid oxidase-like deaminating enzyme